MGVTGGTKTIDITNLPFIMDAGNVTSFTSGDTKAYNLMGNNTGSLINNTEYSSDGGGCWRFDGTDDRIDCDTFTNIVSAGSLANYTIEIWIKAASGATPGYDIALGSKDTKFNEGGYSILWHGGAGYMADGTWGASTRRYPQTGTSIDDDVWNHITVAYNGSNIYIYHAGIDSSTYPTAETGDMAAAAEQFCIGGSDTAWAEWDGWITAVRIYDKALTQAEVLQNYNATKERFGL